MRILIFQFCRKLQDTPDTLRAAKPDQLRLERGFSVNGQNEHVDGDDYTWQTGPVQAGAVLIPAQPDDEPEPGTADAWADRWQRQAARANGAALELPAELAADGWQLHQAAGPDLRTLAEQERDDVAQLALRCDNLVDTVEAAHRRLAALEGIVRAKVQVGQIDAGRLDTLEHELNLLIQRVDGSTRLAQLEATVAALVKVLEVRI